MVFCPNCGSQVDDGSKFCASCGNPMDGSAPAGNTQMESTGSLFGDIKKTGLGFKKKMDNYAHGEHKNIQRPEGCLYFINGLQGTLAIFEDYIEFDFSGSAMKKYMSGFGGVKKVYYHQINSIQKRDATDMVNGTIEFELPGMAASTFSQNENLITYLPKYQGEAERIYDYVNDKILSIHQANSQPTQVVQTEASPMAKLKEAKELLDMGVITQEEFDEIKAKCLANM
ncbi:zinc-ribbon domain-containing protein [Methanobrevibacter sp.]